MRTYIYRSLIGRPNSNGGIQKLPQLYGKTLSPKLPLNSDCFNEKQYKSTSKYKYDNVTETIWEFGFYFRGAWKKGKLFHDTI
jgi:hypothetical protein